MKKDKRKVFVNPSPLDPVIAWWSGGVASAVTCKRCIEIYGVDNVMVVFINTRNEDDDTHRFLRDCEAWYGTKIHKIASKQYESIEDVWYRYLSLNSATGAICSTELKRVVRQDFIKRQRFSMQAFGFDKSEKGRVDALKKSAPHLNPIFPISHLTKEECISIVQEAGIPLPSPYLLGYRNNNCFQTGCVQGGIGYWQKIWREQPAKFDKMADLEHELTDLKGEPVTILKDQSKKSPGLVFLKPHPKYPHMKDISMMKGREVKPLADCNGFCARHEPKKKLNNYENRKTLPIRVQ